MKYLYALVFIFFSFFCKAQTIYGNEWIKPNQKYLKIKLSEDGIYRINYSQLQSAGFLNNNPNPKNFQIYYRGVEIPLYIEGEQDNAFDSTDFIEFLGKKNNGKLDESLYAPTSLQPNPEVSLFSDESSYFLTVSSSTGKRYLNKTLAANGISPENYMVYTSSSNFAESYYPGSYLIDVMSLSEYIEGEGYLGNTFGLGSSQGRILSTPKAFNTPNFSPILSFYVAGRSNAKSTDVNKYNHHIRISISNTSLFDQKYEGYATIRSQINLSNSLITSNNTTINFSSVNDLGAETDYQAIGYARITYARSFDVSNEFSYLPFKIASGNNECVLNFTNTNWAEAYIFDETHGFRYAASKQGTTSNFVVSNPAENSLYVFDRSSFKTPILENINLTPFNIQSTNAALIIVTHKNLIDAATEYASYKTSMGYKSLVVTTEELYNQFYYGQHHPLAIKNFVRYLLSNAPQKPEYLLLLGKGYETPKDRLGEDLVPTMGFPASDSYLTSGILDASLAPALATGRVPAKSNDEVRVYLDKVKQYDQQPNDIWRKNIINISGGKDSYEDSAFSGFLNGMSKIAEKEYFGAKSINYYKSVTDPITDNLMAKISNNINEGVGLLNFLGHGSTTSTAVSIGNPVYLNNNNKLLVYLINGCSTGNAFVNGSLGEDYIFQQNKGAIAWIGTSSEGVASYLNNFTSQLFQNSFNTNFGNSISKNILTTVKSYQNVTDNFTRAHLRQYIFLGDPTLAFYSPKLPDYEIRNQDIDLHDKNVSSNSPIITLFAVIRNHGKATSNNIPITITRTLSNNTSITYPNINYKKILNTDTVIFQLDNNIANTTGLNKFTITIDPSNTINELNKNNNKAEFTYLIQSNGITAIKPNAFGIVGSQDVELKIQANDLFKKEQNYIFEIDTLISFDSNWKKNSGNILGNTFAVWKPHTSLENNKVYYWRAKAVDASSQNNEWQTSSFTYINTIDSGWNQSHYQQYDNITLSNIKLSRDKKHFEYTNTAFPVLIRTKGNNGPASTERRIRGGITVGAVAFNGPDFEGFSIAAFDPKTTWKLYNYPSVYNFKNDGVNGTGQFFFNTNDPVEVDSLTNYLNNIPQNYYVIGLSGRNFNPKNLPLNTQNALVALGLTKFQTINNGDPYAFWTQKSSRSEFNTLELTADYGSATPAGQQIIDFSYDLLYPWDNGSYISEKIGPAVSWVSADINLNKKASDQLAYTIIGVKQNGDENILKSNLSNPVIDLTDISADTYPYLKLKADAKNPTEKALAQLNGWKVLFTPYPDLSFNPEIVNLFYDKNIHEGDSLKLSIGITNLEKTQSESVEVRYKLTKNDRSTVTGLIKTIKPLALNEKASISFNYPTLGIPDANVLQLTLVPKDSKDKNEFNNYAIYNFNVIRDKKEPVIDVLFDNKRIINGEIVSSKPQIQISVYDENKFLVLKDTTSVEVYLKEDKQADFKRISFKSNKISIQSNGSKDNNKIVFLYVPDLLADGNYTLKLRGKDISGNYNTTNDYIVNFEVINEQSITNFLPYPNPFTTSMKFVFQVTGKIPDKIKIQIMTVTGKIVREVFKQELGDIKIGNNVSDFTWDGTDQYGDRLANGVYFYNVIIENEDKSEIKHRNNKTDVFFKKNFGKIYLMR